MISEEIKKYKEIKKEIEKVFNEKRQVNFAIGLGEKIHYVVRKEIETFVDDFGKRESEYTCIVDVKNNIKIIWYKNKKILFYKTIEKDEVENIYLPLAKFKINLEEVEDIKIFNIAFWKKNDKIQFDFLIGDENE